MKFLSHSLLFSSLIFASGALFAQDAGPNGKGSKIGTGDAEGTGGVSEGNMSQGEPSAQKESGKPLKSLAETSSPAKTDASVTGAKSSKSVKKGKSHHSHKAGHRKTKTAAADSTPAGSPNLEKSTGKSSKTHHRRHHVKKSASSAKPAEGKISDDKVGADKPEPTGKN